MNVHTSGVNSPRDGREVVRLAGAAERPLRGKRLSKSLPPGQCSTPSTPDGLHGPDWPPPALMWANAVVPEIQRLRWRVQELEQVEEERDRLQAALRRSEGRVRLFVTYTPAAVAMFDRPLCTSWPVTSGSRISA